MIPAVGQTLLFGLVGLVSGFCSSAPLGPINLWLVEAVSSQRRRSSIFAFLSGVIITDMVFAATALWGYFALIRQTGLERTIILAGASFLIIMGLISLVRLRRNGETTPARGPGFLAGITGPAGHFFSGALFCGSNPAFLMFWVFVVNLMEKGLEHYKLDPFNSALFLAGVALGDAVWFTLLTTLVRKGLNIAKPRLLLGLRVGIAGAFLVFGVIALWRNLST